MGKGEGGVFEKGFPLFLHYDKNFGLQRNFEPIMFRSMPIGGGADVMINYTMCTTHNVRKSLCVSGTVFIVHSHACTHSH